VCFGSVIVCKDNLFNKLPICVAYIVANPVMGNIPDVLKLKFNTVGDNCKRQ